MKFYLFNGSNRKKGNTAQLLDAAAEGITDTLIENDVKANVNIINLYDLNYKGCKSCYHCKKVDGKYYGICPIKDDLLELLPKVWNSDGIVIGSPIYFGNLSGETRSFLERLMFPKLDYGNESLSENIPTGFIYTMDLDKEIADVLYSESVYNTTERFLRYTFKKVQSLKSHDTYQFNSYSIQENTKYEDDMKRKANEEAFQNDIENAYKMGADIVEYALKKNR